ncbi:MAG: deoxyguanosinetriphosphate triphosphohydrolase [Actinomyces urogenitalis]|uniref:Deoxyguanosinetriphosphate triphosphohydrolase-like protein n=2 Tax=Actinomyces urogenitalis TaxID=103621 RepID=C0W3X8_9ACTO|nr:deoxyguanosinetriphosphate triphosphohydrolase [Actinomyces urogenitalis]EEH66592.1 putative dGTPase [Actinomyces urogenitalis DSM 15434]MDK8835870.1 deoxyguanosinetriphosphate triphosphohydrolase [Actinomyces urogenitalis]MDU0971273.1 deoxyguanosinetriphosphate triphosphohydrolase [Actinomyces urogenitalis]MDU6151186.1 deoxyguanosinetriphosphate triphosphohydrolase [Actinomyces urogenitalis]PKY99373.1 deoxyguanosinetriphosphate triphosphohydrolase [Actinomyces urogenitalis]
MSSPEHVLTTPATAVGEDRGDLIGYGAHDVERFVTEAAKNPQRTPFERDRARVLHSSALRRLGAKTQVLGPSADDFVRTRLTHSLEVAQVGRAIGQALGCDPDVVDTACLAHDLGHPPYGHNGEKALDQVAASIGGFEGNAQTLRLLTRLEPKTLDASGRSVGLNLTRASLDAVAKYPWARGEGPGGPEGKSARKYCCYDDDREVFAWMRAGAPALRRCLEAQVMDFSDDVGYSVHDVEDAIALGKMDPATLRSAAESQAVVEATLNWYGHDLDAQELEAAWRRLTALESWIAGYTGSMADAAGLKNMTSQLIGRFVSEVARATREVFGDGPLARYDADLVIPEGTRAEILVLKGAAVRYVMAPREHEPVYLRQRTELFDLADVLTASGDEHLEPVFAEAWRQAADDAGRLRAVVDQIASLTDTSARQWHARLCGLFSQV